MAYVTVCPCADMKPSFNYSVVLQLVFMHDLFLSVFLPLLSQPIVNIPSDRYNLTPFSLLAKSLWGMCHTMAFSEVEKTFLLILYTTPY